MINSRARRPTKGAHVLKQSPKSAGAVEKLAEVRQTTAAPPGRPITRRKIKSRRRMPRIVGLLGAGAVILALAGLFGFNYGYPHIFPGVSAGSIKVGGKTMAEAEQLIQEQCTPLYQDASLSIAIYDEVYTIPVTDVLEGVDSHASARAAYDTGRTGNPFQRVGQMLGAFFGRQEVSVAATVQEEGLKQTLNDIAAKALTEPVEPSWETSDGHLIIHAGQPGVHFDTDAVGQALAEKIRLMDFSSYTVNTEVTEAPAIDLEKIAAEVIQEAADATVSREDGQTIIPERIGVQFDLEEARKIIGDGSASTYTIPATITYPNVTAADLKEKLFRDTLARTSTELNEGNVPRTNNVRLAAEAINGLILNPGDEFSYNDVVGERTEERGYKPAGAYANGQVIEEYGGGVCQPSSTLYMAVLRADLEVTERVNHSFPVSYTPLGEDATVSWGGPDFRFRNNTGYPLKILAEQTDGQMIMTLIGTKTSDKSVTTRTDVIETYPPETVRVQDASLSAGETSVEQGGITGYLTKTYQQITVNGETTEVLANTSHYTSRNQIIHVGTGSSSSSSEQNPQSSQTEPSGNTDGDTSTETTPSNDTADTPDTSDTPHTPSGAAPEESIPDDTSAGMDETTPEPSTESTPSVEAAPPEDTGGSEPAPSENTDTTDTPSEPAPSGEDSASEPEATGTE